MTYIQIFYTVTFFFYCAFDSYFKKNLCTSMYLNDLKSEFVQIITLNQTLVAT